MQLRFVSCLLLVTASLQAGVIQGEVLEQASGRPLARTIVRLIPVPGQPSGSVRGLQIRANGTGHFVFPSVPDGLYLLTVQRKGYSTSAYGQRRPTGQGTPILVTPDSDLFAEFHMRKMGAISGRVLDENGIGLPDVTVLAYPARLPLRSVAEGKSDDRGVYRIAGLEPGKYWIRTAAAILDDGSGLLPTFGPLSRETHDARVQVVNLDEEAQDANVQPEPGLLFRLTGKILCDRPDGTPVTVTLSSETGKRSARSACAGSYVLEGLAPALYEILATYEDPGGFGFVELSLDHNSDLGNVQLMKPPQVDIEFRNAADKSMISTSFNLVGRRDDLSSSDLPIKIPSPRATLAPGHWEMNAVAGPDQYVQAIVNQYRTGTRPRADRPAEWFDIFIDQRASARIQVMVSDRAGHITGTVALAGASIPGSPVFLWPVADDARRSLGGTRQTLTDTQGHFDFPGLPPGDYRVLATFDFSQADLEVFEEARAPTITVGSGQRTLADLTLWVAP
jgi:protocatechuate 3,4-dioxygenase beta subunit